jgi:hypothetical protein
MIVTSGTIAIIRRRRIKVASHSSLPSLGLVLRSAADSDDDSDSDGDDGMKCHKMDPIPAKTQTAQ